MTAVTLVYPYFQTHNDRSIFRFPPLGLGYIASYLKNHNISVDLVDCTFLKQKEALERIRQTNPKIIGIYAMYSMKNKAIEMARLIRKDCELLVAGGPLPTVNPSEFLQHFDLVVMGEGEETMLEVVRETEGVGDPSRVRGIAYKRAGSAIARFTNPRKPMNDLDHLPFPGREFFDNQAYKDYYFRKFGYMITSLITSRGCPFKCDFCSRPVFGNTFRARSAANIVDEMESILRIGYNRIWFADDCFTLGRKRFVKICDEIIERGIKIDWECLSRVDTIDRQIANKMRQAGCERVFFGIESGNDSVLRMMRKQISTDRAKKAVITTRQAGIKVGAFFIVGYPGETNDTILDTVNFAASLPLNYVDFTMPYPIPGTPLYNRVKERMMLEEYEEPKGRRLVKHRLLFNSPFSEAKLKFAIIKGAVQHTLRKKLGTESYKIIGKPFEQITNYIFKLLH